MIRKKDTMWIASHSKLVVKKRDIYSIVHWRAKKSVPSSLQSEGWDTGREGYAELQPFYPTKLVTRFVAAPWFRFIAFVLIVTIKGPSVKDVASQLFPGYLISKTEIGGSVISKSFKEPWSNKQKDSTADFDNNGQTTTARYCSILHEKKIVAFILEESQYITCFQMVYTSDAINGWAG